MRSRARPVATTVSRPAVTAGNVSIGPVHPAPQERAVRVEGLLGRLGPVSIAEIHSANDEFAPVDDVSRVFDSESHSGRLWKRAAFDHQPSDDFGEFDRRVLEDLACSAAIRPR